MDHLLIGLVYGV